MGSDCNYCGQEDSGNLSSTSFPIPQVLQRKLDPYEQSLKSSKKLQDPQSIFFKSQNFYPYQQFLISLKQRESRFVDVKTTSYIWIKQKDKRNGYLNDKFPLHTTIQSEIDPLDIIFNKRAKQAAKNIISNMQQFSLVLRAIATISPASINQMILTKNNNYGFHVVKMFVNGIPTNIVVDDFIPLSEDGRPMFVQTQGSNIWPIILQKAWAKLSQSYSSQDQLIPNQLMQELLGCRCYNYQLKNFDQIQADLRDGRIVIISANTRPDHGLNPQQYFFVRGFNIINHRGRKVKLFRLQSVYPYKLNIRSRIQSDLRQDIHNQIQREIKKEVYYFTDIQIQDNFKSVFVANINQYSKRLWIQGQPNCTTSFFKINIGIQGALISLRILQHYSPYVLGKFYQYSKIGLSMIDLDNNSWLLQCNRMMYGQKSLSIVFIRFF